MEEAASFCWQTLTEELSRIWLVQTAKRRAEEPRVTVTHRGWDRESSRADEG